MIDRPDQPEDRRLEQMLDRLGERERAVPDGGFEARLVSAAIAAARNAPGPRALGGASLFRATWLRVAAAIAIVGSASVAALMMRGGGGAPNTTTVADAETVAQELDAWLDDVSAQTRIGQVALVDDVALPVGWGELALDFWGDDDPVMGSSGWDIESF